MENTVNTVNPEIDALTADKIERIEERIETARGVTKLATMIGIDLIVTDVVALAWFATSSKRRFVGFVLRSLASGTVAYGIYDKIASDTIDAVFDDLKEKCIAKVEKSETKEEL